MALDDLEKSLGLTEPMKEGDEEKDQSREKEGSEGQTAEEEESEAADEDADRVRERERGDDQGLEQSGDDGDSEGDADLDASGEEDKDSEEPGDEDPNELKRQNAGLRKELAKMRELSRVSRFQPQQQPTIPQARQTTAQQPRQTLVPVQVSEDGKSVFVDPAALDAVVTERAIEINRRAAAPSPQQIVNQQVSEATQEFLGQDPRNKKIVDRVHEIDEYLTYHVAQMVQEGLQITNVPDALDVLKARGVDQKVLDAYPELADIGFDDFFEQMSAGTKSSRRMLLKSLSAALPAQRARAPKRQANGAKRALGDQPKALARKGGGKNTAATSDEREYRELEQEFNANVLNPKAFPDAKYKRMVSLGKKIGMDGYE